MMLSCGGRREELKIRRNAPRRPGRGSNPPKNPPARNAPFFNGSRLSLIVDFGHGINYILYDDGSVRRSVYFEHDITNH